MNAQTKRRCSDELDAWKLATRYAYAMGGEAERARSATWIGEMRTDHSAPLVVIHWFGAERSDHGVVRIMRHQGRDLPDIDVWWASDLRRALQHGDYDHPWTRAVEDLLNITSLPIPASAKRSKRK